MTYLFMPSGNLTEDLNKFQELYNQLLEQGKDLYGVSGDFVSWVFALEKRERVPFEEGSNGLRLTLEDAKEYKKIFPDSKRDVERIMEETEIEPYSRLGYAWLGDLSTSGLQKILGGSYVTTRDDREHH